MRDRKWSVMAAVLAGGFVATTWVVLAQAPGQPGQPGGPATGQPATHPPHKGAHPPEQAAHPAGHHWGYEGAEGPQAWGTLEHDYAACAEGKHQSPVDIHAPQPADLPALAFDYQPSPLKIVDNGHTIQVNFAPGSRVTVGGATYALVQMHFHHPGENTLDERAFPMEAHLVHKDAQGKLAVVAVFLQEGKANPFLDRLWENLPTVKDKEQAPAGVTVDPSEFLPPDRGYDTFQGSLTTPPCTEGVTWLVLKTPVEIGAAQVNRFAQIYRMNARPVQQLNDRTVQASK
jgi:carbonic anhydrase